jgi:carboxyl-terminal processing protease
LIKVNSVESKSVEFKGQNYLYVRIESFSSKTSDDLKKSIVQFLKDNKTIPGMILDLRNNPGGLLDQAIKVADLFLKSGPIVITKGKKIEAEIAENDDYPLFPLVTLINSDSASASEIVAGALQDHNRSLIVGQPSFGKASVQTVFDLPDDHALKITIARYYTPNGRSIQNTGITPDIWIQKVLTSDKNLNLLGENRYKSENFLKRHLSRAVGDLNPQYSYRWNKFYFQDAVKNSKSKTAADDSELTPMEDIDAKKFEFETLIALNLLSAAEHDSILREMDIETHKLLIEKDTLTKKSLLKSFGLRWENPMEHTSNQKEPKIMVKMLGPKNFTNVKPGEKIRIPFSLKNTENLNIKEISIFVKSDVFYFPTQEKLLGTLKEQETLNDVIEFEIPSYLSDKILDLDLGVAISGEPISDSFEKLLVSCTQKQFGKLEAQFRYKETSASVYPGVLESLENAFIEIELKNTSQIPLKKVALKSIDLSGHQIEILSKDLNIDELQPLQKKQILVKIRAKQKLHDAKINLGFIAESTDLEGALREKFEISTHANIP